MNEVVIIDGDDQVGHIITDIDGPSFGHTNAWPVTGIFVELG